MSSILIKPQAPGFIASILPRSIWEGAGYLAPAAVAAFPKQTVTFISWLISRTTIYASGRQVDTAALAGRFATFAGKRLPAVRTLGIALLALAVTWKYSSSQRQYKDESANSSVWQECTNIEQEGGVLVHFTTIILDKLKDKKASDIGLSGGNLVPLSKDDLNLTLEYDSDGLVSSLSFDILATPETDSTEGKLVFEYVLAKDGETSKSALYSVNSKGEEKVLHSNQDARKKIHRFLEES